MRATSARVENEALLVACAICAVPSAILSMVESSPISLFVFFIISYLHGLMLGLPAFWFLSWRKAANPFTCAATGAMIGFLPYAIIFAPGMSGPGVNHPKTLFHFGVSGLAIGFVFSHYLKFRMRNAD